MGICSYAGQEWAELGTMLSVVQEAGLVSVRKLLPDVWARI